MLRCHLALSCLGGDCLPDYIIRGQKCLKIEFLLFSFLIDLGYVHLQPMLWCKGILIYGFFICFMVIPSKSVMKQCNLFCISPSSNQDTREFLIRFHRIILWSVFKLAFSVFQLYLQDFYSGLLLIVYFHLIS